MARKSKHARGLADPSRLPPLDRDGDNIIQVVIETPKGSRNKFAFDDNQKVFQLKKVLPAGMAFPHDFGFIPSTKAEDGDPVDVLVLMDEPAYPGVLLKCRVVGVIEGQQGSKKQKERNDRIVAVEQENHSYAFVKHVRDLGKKFLRELEEFFVNCHELSDEKYEILDVKGPAEARRRIKDGMHGVRRKRYRSASSLISQPQNHVDQYKDRHDNLQSEHTPLVEFSDHEFIQFGRRS